MSSIGAFIVNKKEQSLYAISGESLIKLTPEISVLIKTKDSICAAAFNEDNTELAIITADKTFAIYAYPSLELKSSFEIDRKSNIVAQHRGTWTFVTRFGIVAAVNPAGDAIASIYTSIVSMPTSAEFNQKFCCITDRDGHVRLYDADLSSHKIIYCLNGHRSYVLGAKFLGKLIVSASNDGSIKIWDTEAQDADTGLKVVNNYRMEQYLRLHDVYGDNEKVCVLWQDKSDQKKLTVIRSESDITERRAPNCAAKYFEHAGKAYYAAESSAMIFVDEKEIDLKSFAGSKINEQITADLLIKMKERGE